MTITSQEKLTTISEKELLTYLWLKGELSFLLEPQQWPIYEAIRNLPNGVMEFVVLCARQYGKSVIGVLLALQDAIRHRDVCILIIGPDTKQTKDIVNPRMRMLASTAPEGLIHASRSDNKWIIFHDRMGYKQRDYSEIVIGGMNENSSSQRGKTVYRIYIEEVVDIHPDHYLESLESDLGPALTRSKCKAGQLIFLTTLPKIPDHPFITHTYTKALLENAVASFDVYENVSMTEEQFAAAVKRCGGEDSIAFRREYRNELVRDDSVVVVPPYNQERHVKPFLNPLHANWIIAMDGGGVRDKSVGFLMTYDYLRNKILVRKEFVYKPNTPTSEIVDQVREWQEDEEYQPKKFVADVPGQTQVDMSLEHELEVITPIKTDWQAGINLLNVKFSQDEIEIHPDCTFLQLSLRSGTLNKAKTDFERTEALGHCDALAALIYGIRALDTSNPYPDSYGTHSRFIRPRENESEIRLSSAFGRSFIN